MDRLMRRVGFAAAMLLCLSGAALPAESTIEIAGPSGPLQATLLSPQPGAPALIIVPGSGPTDRDGNNPLGVSAASYRLLAEGLAARGIASVRIDKRGMFGSKGAVPDANAVTIADYAADVRGWVDKTRALTHADCVWVLGHSEGGLVALAAAAADGDGICGLILAASPGRPMGDVLREQLRSNPANAPVLDAAFAAIAALEEGKSVDVATLHPALVPLFHPAVQGFLKDAMSYDPAKLLAASDKPVLIVQGERDIQITKADAQRLEAAGTRAELVLIPDVNHVLKVVATDDRAANIATYADPALPIAPQVVDAIAGFVTRHSAAR